MAKPEVVNYLLDVAERAAGIRTFRESLQYLREHSYVTIDQRFESLGPAVMHVVYPALMKSLEGRNFQARTPRETLASAGAVLADLSHIIVIAGLGLAGHNVEAGLVKVGYNLLVEALPDALRSIRRNSLPMATI